MYRDDCKDVYLTHILNSRTVFRFLWKTELLHCSANRLNWIKLFHDHESCNCFLKHHCVGFNLIENAMLGFFYGADSRPIAEWLKITEVFSISIFSSSCHFSICILQPSWAWPCLIYWCTKNFLLCHGAVCFAKMIAPYASSCVFFQLCTTCNLPLKCVLVSSRNVFEIFWNSSYQIR